MRCSANSMTEVPQPVSRRPSPSEQQVPAAQSGLSIIGAVVLASMAALLTLSIIAAALARVPLLAVPGAFFFDAYGYLAFLVPAYLFVAALILADRAYRPDRVFALSCTVVPFLTLAAGAALLRDPLLAFDRYPVLESMGRQGLGAAIAAIAALECLGIVALTAALFPSYLRSGQARKARKPADDKSEAPSSSIALRFLPAPKAPSKTSSENVSPRVSSLEKVYLGAAEAVQGRSRDEDPPPAAAARLDLDRLLPELKPLSSLAAEKEFARGDSEIDSASDDATVEAEGYFFTSSGPLVPKESEAAHAKKSRASAEADDPTSDSFIPLGFVDVAVPAGHGDAAASAAATASAIAGAASAAAGIDSVVDLSPLFSRDGEKRRPGEEIIDPSIFFEEEETMAGAPDQTESGGAAADEVAEASSGGDADDLSRALSEAEAEAAAKSRAAEEAAAAKAAEGEHHASSLRKRRNEPYGVPVDGILTSYPDGQYWVIDQATRDAAVILKETLEEFNIAAEVTGIRKGPVITMFEILPAPGVKLSKIVNLQDNIALRLAASSVRIVAPIPGKHAVGIEVPNRKRNIVSFREMIEGELAKAGKDSKKAEIPVILGKDITGEAQTLDLVQTPHLLIAGSTGSGKSVCVNSMILSILYQRSPAEVRLILIDPKIVELKLYNDIPHLLTPVITEPKRAFQALQYCIYEMERRYALLDSMGVRDIRSYNKRIKERNIAAERIPYIVVVIDEFADLMATTGKELESTVARLAAMSRAVGIHLVLATQRPSIDVITGLIKANIPSRIAFMVAGKMDSRIIIDMVGAEKLLGKGDMLVASAWDPFPIRMQGAFVSEEEVERVVEYVKTLGEPDYLDEEIFYDEDEEDAEPSLFGDDEDPLYEKALEIVHQQGKASASYIQRRLKIGYNRAARLVEMMEDRGIVGPAQGSKPRDLLRGS